MYVLEYTINSTDFLAQLLLWIKYERHMKYY